MGIAHVPCCADVDEAVRPGYFACLQRLIRWDVCEWAAQTNRLDVLQLARQNDYEWGERPVRQQLKGATWSCCSGQGWQDVPGTRKPAAVRQCPS